jgi:hypothetical protein
VERIATNAVISVATSGTGLEHGRTPVLMLVQDLHVRVINAAAGELIRELTIDPNATTSPPPTTRTQTKETLAH